MWKVKLSFDANGGYWGIISIISKQKATLSSSFPCAEHSLGPSRHGVLSQLVNFPKKIASHHLHPKLPVPLSQLQLLWCQSCQCPALCHPSGLPHASESRPFYCVYSLRDRLAQEQAPQDEGV